MKKNLLFTIIALFISVAAMADGGSCGANLTWDYNSSTHTLTISGTGAMYDYGLVDQPWYSHRNEIQSVVISSGVTYIGENAFGYNYENVTSLSLPNTLIEIGESAFYECSMTTLTIPNSVTTLGSSAFSATAVETLTVGTGLITGEAWPFTAFSSMTNLQTVNWNAAIFPECALGSTLTNPNTSLTTLVLGNQVEIIGPQALHNFTALTSVNLGSVETIREQAFWNCTSLQTVNWGNSLETIESDAFRECSSLQSANLPNSLTSIGDRAFYYSGIQSITIPKNVTSVGSQTFNHCESLTTVVYKAVNCNNCKFWSTCPVTNVTIGDDVTLIPSGLMSYISTLTSLTMGNSVTHIGDGAFHDCALSGDLFLSNSLIEIGDHAFENNTGLDFVEIPGGVTDIGFDAFEGTNVFDVNMLPTTPPDNNSSFPFNDPNNNVTFHVPCGCSKAYNEKYYTVVHLYNLQIVESEDCTYSITVASSNVSLGGVSGSGTYNYGQNVTVVATPYGDADFVNWTEDGEEVSTNSSYSFTANANRTLIANFVETVCTISATAVPAAGGTITGTGTYNNGDFVSLMATPKNGYVFEKWTENGTTIWTMPNYYFMCSGSRTLKAHFTYVAGVEESENESLAVYPNPTNGVFNVECDGMTEIEVYSCDGRLIQRVNTCDNSIQIDLTNLSSGIYNLNIITKDGSVRKSIIKM